MKAHIGSKIELPTRHGKFDVQHVSVLGDAAGVIREGVVLHSNIINEPVLVRVQSSCLFSETFWATDCDCALQLQHSLHRIGVEGGVLLYFYEEGRGAGLAVKFKAIELQQMQGMDTRQAYECLNTSVDKRSYEAAATVLKLLVSDKPIILLSNNPEKAAGLSKYGVNVLRRENLICGWDQPEIRRYLEEKREILRHDIPNDKDR
jgi:GTP cyclohydrolase II